MVLMAAVLWMLIVRARDPDTWRWLASGREQTEEAERLARYDPDWLGETHEGPNDTDRTEQERSFHDLGIVTDRTPLQSIEMNAYWRLVRWARNTPLMQLFHRADANVLFTQLWEQPDKHRGKPIRLNLQIRRVLRHDAPENDLGITHLYEAWGPTEESRSFPYVVVFEELPPGMPVGPDVYENGTFVGYFHKILQYQAYDKTRGAPMLIGRMHWRPNPQTMAKVQPQHDVWPWVLIGGLALLMVARGVVVVLGRTKPRPSLAVAPVAPFDESQGFGWLSGPPEPPERQAADDDGPSSHSQSVDTLT